MDAFHDVSNYKSRERAATMEKRSLMHVFRADVGHYQMRSKSIRHMKNELN